MSPNPASQNGKPLSVGFVSLGCAKNTADSQVIAGSLIRAGFTLAPSTDRADIVLVNTCAFIRAAREESLAEIRQLCRAKADGKHRAVIVAGCLPQKEAQTIAAQLPDVDAFLGIDQLDAVPDIIRQTLEQGPHTLSVSHTAHRLFDPPVPGLVFSKGAYAYLKIAEGCDHLCTFCTIPSIRGKLRSRPIDALLREAAAVLDQGFRELCLVSQDSTAYGTDLPEPRTLTDLLRALTGLGDEFRIRILYGYPTRVTPALLQTLAQLPNLCRYLDVPVQHSHPDILRLMGRAQTADSVAALPAAARKALPDITLRTTCIVGFPGETDTHFQHLLDYVVASRFEHLGVFTYSPEPGTPAEKLPNPVPLAVAEERRAHLLAAQRRIVDSNARARIGLEADVLVEGRRPGKDGPWVARSDAQAPEVDGFTLIRGKLTPEHVGEFIRVRYTRQRDYDMEAVPVLA